MIKLVQVPLVRDTLELRQELLSGNTDQFKTSLARLEKEPRWKTGSSVLLTWKLRGLMQSASLSALADLADGMNVSPGAANAEELLEIKLAVQVCGPKEMGVLCGIESDLYRCDYNAALSLYSSCDKNIRTPFLLDVLGRRLVDSGHYDLLLKASSMCSDSIAPESMYYLGLALCGTGNRSEGRKCLDALLTKNLSSVFAQRARIYLIALNKTDATSRN